MVSSYTTNKYIEKPANGDYNNTWSTPVNSDWDVIDTAFGGTTTINAVGASGTVTLTTTQYRPPIIAITGTLTANVNYQLPAGVGGFWYIFNNTSGAFSILFSSAGGGSTVTVPQGYTVAVICDGTNVGLSTTNAALISSSYSDPAWIASLAASKLTGAVAVANGGTGQTTYTDGQLLIGNSTGNTLTKATLTAGTGIAITNSAGGITIAAAAGGGTVTSVGGTGTVNGITLTGTVTTSGNLTLGGTLSGVSLTSQVTGTLPIANGGTNATTAAGALTSLGAYPAANPSGYTSNTGTVTSVAGTGTVSGLTLTGTVTTSGSLTLGGTLSVAASNFSSQTANTFLAAPNGSAGVPTFRAIAAADVPTLNQNTTGTAANVTGTVAVANGGTGATTAANAFDAIVAVASTLADPGYIKLQNGLHIIWGSFSAAANGSTSVTYPSGVSLTSFSIAVCNGVGEFSTTAQDNFPTVSSCGTTGFSAWNANNSCTAFYIAIGY
jgi:hypothetical protein